MAVMEQLPSELTDRAIRQTVVRDVRVEHREDANGEPAIFIVLVLSDPPGDAETWPVEDLWKLRALVREKIEALTTPPLPWYVVFEPEHPDLPPDDGELLDPNG